VSGLQDQALGDGIGARRAASDIVEQGLDKRIALGLISAEEIDQTNRRGLLSVKPSAGQREPPRRTFRSNPR